MKYIYTIPLLTILNLSNVFCQTNIQKNEEIISLLNGDWKINIPIYYFWMKYDSTQHYYELKLNNDSTGTFTKKLITLAPFIKLKSIDNTFFMCHYFDSGRIGEGICHQIISIKKNKLIIKYDDRKIKYKRIKPPPTTK